MADKIAIVGAGSIYTPELVSEFFRDGGRLVKFDRLALMDVDERRLGIVGGLTQRMAGRQGVRAKVDLTTSLRAAVRGARFVIVQIRVGGNEARLKDEMIPARHGVVGQETTGPGGMFKALRTIPALVKIGRAVRDEAPRAWMLNFANPSGLVTEAVLKAVPGLKMLGICSIQVGRDGWFAGPLRVPASRIRTKSFGLNHLAWVYRVLLDGRDVTGRLLKRKEGWGGFSRDLLGSVRGFPIGYLHYYYDTDEVVAKQRKGRTRAREVLRLEKLLLKRYADPRLDEPPKELSWRGGSGYSVTMTAIMRALTGQHPITIPTCVQNRGAVEGFAFDQVLEIPARLSPAGVTPLRIPLGEIPPHQLGLTHQVKAYESLTAEAALTGSYEKALAAMITHPLVPSVSVGKKILDEMLRAHRKHLSQFR